MFVIKQHKSATTPVLFTELNTLLRPTGEDAEILAGRKDTKFSQKLRKLVSHREANEMKEYTDFTNGKYALTASGEKNLLYNSKIFQPSYRKICYYQMLNVSFISAANIIRVGLIKTKNAKGILIQ